MESDNKRTKKTGQPVKLTAARIKEEMTGCHPADLPGFLQKYKEDDRAAVQKVLLTAQKKYDNYQKELDRIYNLQKYEREYSDYEFICGIDEVGRGPLAGPVYAGAVILPKNCDILRINDSKQLSEKVREELYDEITAKAVAWAVGFSTNERIDEINILQATYEAMRKAIAQLDPQPTLLLNDAVTIPEVEIPQVPIIKGDAKSISIGAASIVAKVTRDRLMVEYDKIYPGYGFASNKGYGSAEHIAALKKLGPTPIHRRTFIGNFI